MAQLSHIVQTSSLPKHCTPTSQYLIELSSIFHSCVPTTLAFVSTALGVCSIASWLCAQMPQIYKNYKLKSASGLSIYFLGEWLLGDLTNLIGAVLTSQASWMIIVASYYVFVDICLVSQYLWYTHYKSWAKVNLLEEDEGNDADGDEPSNVIVGVSPSASIESAQDTSASKITSDQDHKPSSKSQDMERSRTPAMFLSSLDEKRKQHPPSRTTTLHQPSTPLGISPRALLLISFVCLVLCEASVVPPTPSPPSTPAPSQPSANNNVEFAGRVLSWISTLLYLGSRLPQIYKNALRRSTAGLSPTLFAAAFLGNLFYSSSMLTNPRVWGSYPPYGLHGWIGPEGSDRANWVGLAAPFFLGAAGVLVMDATIGVQFVMFGEGVELVVVNDNEEGEREGRSRWRRVSGWMRGWYPSPRRVVPEAEMSVGASEERRPLIGRSRSSGQDGSGGYGGIV